MVIPTDATTPSCTWFEEGSASFKAMLDRQAIRALMQRISLYQWLEAEKWAQQSSWIGKGLALFIKAPIYGLSLVIQILAFIAREIFYGLKSAMCCTLGVIVRLKNVGQSIINTEGSTEFPKSKPTDPAKTETESSPSIPPKIPFSAHMNALPASQIESTTDMHLGSAEAAASGICVAKVSAFQKDRDSLPESVFVCDIPVLLHCPANILQAFQQSMEGSKILNTSFKNPYKTHGDPHFTETFPAQASDLTARHLQILTRIAASNGNGVIDCQLYKDLLTPDQIAELHCLVKETCVSGVVDVHSYGGMGASKIEQLTTPIQMIVIDQSGLEFRGDHKNTGTMMALYADAKRLDSTFTGLQNALYCTMYGTERPNMASGPNFVAVTWNNQKGYYINTDCIAEAIKFEFLQAIQAVATQGKTCPLATGRKINFKFLMAGMGCFASGIHCTDKDRILGTARLRGIQLALEYIGSLPAADQTRFIGKIGRLELPFSVDYDRKDFSGIQEALRTLAQTPIAWGGASKEDALKPSSDQTLWMDATTNCGNPHAMIGNCGEYGSVDSAMAMNARVQRLNALHNTAMQIHNYTHSESLYSSKGAQKLAP